ncbi:DUF3253 domain-containing protein [Sphingomonas qilianensis]|uniref:DUF3253 domain-containing protein n=1 Tax=Sphingomonas qilianensis TaxID=1736690 RepID=A0ABU9XMM8_9SPHN
MNVDDAARDATLALLAGRSSGATVCPSEVARTLTPTDATSTAGAWRSAMPLVHAAVDRLLADGRVQLSWKGRVLAARAGPYRIGRPPRG